MFNYNKSFFNLITQNIKMNYLYFFILNSNFIKYYNIISLASWHIGAILWGPVPPYPLLVLPFLKVASKCNYL